MSGNLSPTQAEQYAQIAAIKSHLARHPFVPRRFTLTPDQQADLAKLSEFNRRFELSILLYDHHYRELCRKLFCVVLRDERAMHNWWAREGEGLIDEACGEYFPTPAQGADIRRVA